MTSGMVKSQRDATMDNPQPSPKAGTDLWVFPVMDAVHRPNGGGGWKRPRSKKT